MTTTYEWDVETIDGSEHQDILDHNHFDTYAEAVAFKADAQLLPGEYQRIVLVRDREDGSSWADRSWAYVDAVTGKLPKVFTDAAGMTVAKVPQRFHNEIDPPLTKKQEDVLATLSNYDDGAKVLFYTSTYFPTHQADLADACARNGEIYGGYGSRSSIHGLAKRGFVEIVDTGWRCITVRKVAA